METCYELETFRVKLIVSDAPRAEKANSAEAALRILRPIYADLDADQEHFTALFLDNKNQMRGYKVLFTGSQTASLVHPTVVFRAALLFGAVAMVIAHNHPSGDPSPSCEDKEIMQELKKAAEILRIRLHDHIILGDGDRFYSFTNAEEEEARQTWRRRDEERKQKREDRKRRRLAKKQKQSEISNAE
jgi:DNA repair protein RadC